MPVTRFVSKPQESDTAIESEFDKQNLLLPGARSRIQLANRWLNNLYIQSSKLWHNFRISFHEFTFPGARSEVYKDSDNKKRGGVQLS